MKRLLCFSLCLGLMVSACKKKSVEESVNKAITQGKAGGGGDGGDGGDGTVTKKDKAAVLKACLPKINARLIQTYQEAQQYFVFRSTAAVTSENAPPLLVYTDTNTPLVFGANDQFGLGSSAANVTTNLNKMAADADVQGQFVARADNAKGWRVYISGSGTLGPGLNQPARGAAFAAPGDRDNYKIYDRESLAIDNVQHAAIAQVEGETDEEALRSIRAADGSAGWYDCAVDDDDAVTLVYTQTQMT